MLAAQPDLGINFGSDRTDANGAPFAMQPTDVAGVVPISHWNNADTNMGMSTGLTDSTGATSTVGVKWQANGTWDAATQENMTDQFPNPSGDFTMMSGYLDNFGGTAAATDASLTSGALDGNGILLSGLNNNQNYDVFVYSLTAVFNRPDGTITVAGSNGDQSQMITTPGTPSTAYIQGSNGNYLIFAGVKPMNGNILIHGDGASFRCAFNGVELVPSAAQPPAAPTIGTATYSNGHITLTFTDNSDNESGFQVQRSTDGTNFTTVTTLSSLNGTGTQGTYVDNNILPSTTYTYKVVAVNGAGSAASGTASATTAAHFPGFIASFYASDTINTYPFDGDSVKGTEQFSPDGKRDEQQMPSGTAVLGYQELLTRPINASGSDAIAPTDAPLGFNSVQGSNGPGHQFAARFSGLFTPEVTGFYTLGPSTDDGGAITWANADANGNPVSPVTLLPAGAAMDNLTTLRGNTLDVCPVVDGVGNAVQWMAGHQYYIQFDMQNNGGGWDYHLYDAISSSATNQGSQTFDVQKQALISSGDVSPGVPTFKTIDAANPNGLAKDNPYYAGVATGGPGEVELDFNNIAADSYNIYRIDNGTPVKIATLPAHTGTLTYVDTGRTNGTQYSYVITGVNIAGETSQANGLHLSATAANVAPAAPVATSATFGAIGGINPLSFNVTVKWNAVPIAASYNILRGTSAGGEGTAPIATGVTGTSYTDPTASANQSYFYVVQAVNSAGSSPNSNEVSVNLPPTGKPNVPNAPTQHFYDNEWWGSPTQSTIGYQTPALIGHSVTAPYVDPTAGTGVIDLHGDDNLAGGSPLPPNGDIADNFSTLFTGQIKVNTGGSYTFHANTDDDGYLVVDGQIVATNPGGHGPQEGNAFPIQLAAGTYDFQFYQSNGGGGWDWHFEWTGPDSANAEAIVPVGPTDGIVNSTEAKPADPTAGTLSVNGTTVTVGWTDNSVSELEYVLQRSTDANFAVGKTTTLVLPFVENKGGTVANGTFSDTGLANGTYFYRLEAVNFDGQSAVLPLGSVTVGKPTLAADFNGDGKVDFSDLLILAQNYGKTGVTHAMGDANGDGSVGFDDLLILAQTYGKTAAGAPQKDGSLLSSVVNLVKTR